MTYRTLTIAAGFAATLATGAAASERTDVTPPLYREMARPTAEARPAGELATTPRIVPAAVDRPAPVLADATAAR